MTDKKLTDEKCKELLEYKAKVNCEMCDLKGKGSCITCTYSLIKQFIEIFNRLQAEIERLKNAYKQCAWERDIFAEDMTQEIKKDCSFLMLDIKTIKTEAYKECLEKVEQRDVSESDFYIMVKKTEFDNLLNELVGDDNA